MIDTTQIIDTAVNVHRTMTGNVVGIALAAVSGLIVACIATSIAVDVWKK
jgi:hypothetical protein